MGADDHNVEAGIMSAGSGRAPASHRAFPPAAAAAAVPGTMRAVVLDAPGPPSALAIRELPVPAAGAGGGQHRLSLRSLADAFPRARWVRAAAMTPAQIAATGNDARVIRNKAKIQATVHNAREVFVVLDSYGSIRAYLASFPDAYAASADMRRRFKFLGDTGVWRLLTSAARDTGG